MNISEALEHMVYAMTELVHPDNKHYAQARDVICDYVESPFLVEVRGGLAEVVRHPEGAQIHKVDWDISEVEPRCCMCDSELGEDGDNLCNECTALYIQLTEG